MTKSELIYEVTKHCGGHTMLELIIDELRAAAGEFISVGLSWQLFAIEVAIRTRLPIYVVADVFKAFDEAYQAASKGGRTKIFITGNIS